MEVYGRKIMIIGVSACVFGHAYLATQGCFEDFIITSDDGY